MTRQIAANRARSSANAALSGSTARSTDAQVQSVADGDQGHVKDSDQTKKTS